MFKPGTAVEKIRAINGAGQCPVGTIGTVVDKPLSKSDLDAGGECMAYIAFHGRAVAISSKNWRPIDTNDSTGITSVEQLKRSLAKPQAVPCE